MKVSDAAGIRLHSDEWFHSELYHPKTPAETERLLEAYDRLVAHLSGHKLKTPPGGYQYVKKASGIHWDIAYRKRKSEADYLTVTSIADRYGVDVPLNRRINKMMNELEDGTRKMGWHNIDEASASAKEIGATLP